AQPLGVRLRHDVGGIAQLAPVRRGGVVAALVLDPPRESDAGRRLDDAEDQERGAVPHPDLPDRRRARQAVPAQVAGPGLGVVARVVPELRAVGAPSAAHSETSVSSMWRAAASTAPVYLSCVPAMPVVARQA